MDSTGMYHLSAASQNDLYPMDVGATDSASSYHNIDGGATSGGYPQSHHGAVKSQSLGSEASASFALMTLDSNTQSASQTPCQSLYQPGTLQGSGCESHCVTSMTPMSSSYSTFPASGGSAVSSVPSNTLVTPPLYVGATTSGPVSSYPSNVPPVVSAMII
ncbi:hypothetical protein DL89DRAFT_8765 [Linderina pennispora]|uniref:Uncharacterized protein n=1 Tax=Linderina pennispora TaxID=61395 RepID=A0A1Y1WKQ8_9FUNG|nr:uncharacterized protein DL89DRAFT_8765 [Linderina pennispora]ORX74063.1 hypothetical protein DL89DRAFT_8765 [Linderina pennispora]